MLGDSTLEPPIVPFPFACGKKDSFICLRIDEHISQQFSTERTGAGIHFKLISVENTPKDED